MSARVAESRRKRLERLEYLLRTKPDAWRSWYWRIEAKVLRFLISMYGDYEPPLADISERRDEGRLYAPLPQHPKPIKPVSVIRAILKSIAALNPWRPAPASTVGDDHEWSWRIPDWMVAAFGLVFLAIVFLILVVAAPVEFFAPRGAGQLYVTRVELQELDVALRRYFADCGVYPTTTQGLTALVRDPGVAGWNGPYVNPNSVALDPWGISYVYSCNETGQFVLTSAGPDMEFGTEDDMSLERKDQMRDAVPSQEIE